MLVFQFGNVFLKVSLIYIKENYSMSRTKVTLFYRWPYSFLDLSSPFAPLWYVNNHY